MRHRGQLDCLAFMTKLAQAATGHAVAAGMEGHTGWLIQADDAGTLIVLLMNWLDTADCLSDQRRNGAQLLQGLLGSAHALSHLEALLACMFQPLLSAQQSSYEDKFTGCTSLGKRFAWHQGIHLAAKVLGHVMRPRNPGKVMGDACLLAKAKAHGKKV